MRALLAVLFLALGLASEAHAQVQLLRVDAYEFSFRGFRADVRTGLIKVQNLAFEKRVSLFMEYEDGLYRESYGEYVGPAEPGWEFWRVSAMVPTSTFTQPPPPLGPRWGDELVVKYEVAGQTYYDNNQGRNYNVGLPDDAEGEILYAGLNVLQFDAAATAFRDQTGATTTTFSGNINVRNLAFAKRVVVRYTTDDWQTFSELPASYQFGRASTGVWTPSPNRFGIERWSFFTTALPADIRRIKYAIRYEVAGQTFWDNNAGNDYVVEVQRAGF